MTNDPMANDPKPGDPMASNPMPCDQWRGQLDAYADSALPPDETANLEAHFRTCPACAAAALERLKLKRMTQSAAARYTASPDFRLRIEKAIQPKRPPTWTFGSMPRFAVAAVALLLIFAGINLWQGRSARQQALAELVDLHVATLASANPVDVVSTDRHTVKPWFQGKLPFTFNIPELQNSPFKLIGGRVAYFENNPAAQLLFQVRGHNLSVFILQDQPGLRLGTGDKSQLGFNTETWNEEGLRYIVVSDVNPADIHALAELLRSAK